MKRNKKLTLSKRILAMMLTVAMVATGIPSTTALAAELPAADQTVVEETAGEELNVVPVDGAQENTEETPAATEEASEVADETPDAAVEAPEAADTTEATPVEEAVEENTAASTVSEIVVTREYLSGWDNADKLNRLTFDGTEGQMLTFLNSVKNYTTVKLDGADSDTINNLKNKLTYKWQKKSGDAYADVTLEPGKAPFGAGEYRIVISLDKIDGLCDAATANVDIVVAKAELSVTGNTKVVKVGDKVSDLKAAITDEEKGYTLKNGYNIVDKKSFVKNVTITVKNAVTGEVLTDDAVFEKDKDYTYTMAVELTEEKSADYMVKDPGVTDITFGDLIPTTMEVEFLKTISYNYGDTVAMPVAGTDYTVKVTYEDTSVTPAKTVEVENPVITSTWLDADKVELQEAPKDAGKYFVKLQYEDATGRFDACDNDAKLIRVEIKPVSIYIKPVLKNTTFTDAAKPYTVTREAEYEVYETTGDVKKEIDKDTFWGVTYNDASKQQPLEPIFVLQVRAAKLDKDRNPQKDDKGAIIYGEWQTADSTKLLTAGENAQYRLVFSGKKAIRNIESGTVSKEVDINDRGTNTQETNYKVDVTDETIDKYAIAITVDKAIEAEIDISAYADDIKHKIYDRLSLYTGRAAYKKAVVKAKEGGTPITDGILTYSWYTGTKNVTKDSAGNENVTYTWDDEVYDYNYTWLDGSHRATSPVSATPGVYKLQISYTDSGLKYKAAPVEIIYEIEKQKVQAEISVPDTTSVQNGRVVKDGEVNKYELLVDNEYSRQSLVNTLDDELSKAVKKIVDNKLNDDYNAADPLGDDLNWAFDYDKDYDDDYEGYYLDYVIERKNQLTGTWEDIGSDDLLPDEEYRASAFVRITRSWYKDNYTGCTATDNGDKYHRSNYIYINTKKMGDIPVKLVVDESKITATSKKYDATELPVPKDAVTLVNTLDGSVVTDAEITFNWEDHYYDIMTAQAVNAGKYTLYASFIGDEKYQPVADTVVGESSGFEITSREITVQATPVENIVAGTEAYYSYVCQTDKYIIGGDILESEKDDFVYGKYHDEEYGEDKYGYKAFSSYRYGTLTNKDGSSVENYVLKGDTTYTMTPNVILRNSDGSPYYYNYGRNYKVTPVRTDFTTVRGNSEVRKLDVSIKDYIKDMEHTIVPREGIAYLTRTNTTYYDEKGEPIPGHWMQFQIAAPKEYFEYGYREDSYFTGQTFVYENSIKEAGGRVVNYDDGYLDVAFNADDFTASNKRTATFRIRWEEGYTEDFVVDFTNAVLEDDLTKAVAPKSLAFNSIAAKMAIGETQQLDVKIKKVRNDDVNIIVYSTDHKEILSVSETGAVVALKKGKASVIATPSYEDKSGELVPIPGAKVAKATITVNDVSAPKLAKPTVNDDWANIYYNALSDGYRREVYVLPGSKIKAEIFEEKIASVKNGDYVGAGFVMNPVTTERTTLTSAVYASVYGLTPNTSYSVYVRNVSAVRTLGDGSVVDFSKAGSVVSIKTALSRNEEIKVKLDEKYLNVKTGEYDIALTEGKTDLIPYGVFWERFQNEDPKVEANYSDKIELNIPLGTSPSDIPLTKFYEQPKMAYFVTDTVAPAGYSFKDITTKMQGSRIAKADKKGKLTLLGTGKVYVYACDTTTGHYGYVIVNVLSDPDRMTVAKSATLRVGENKLLKDYVTYYQGKKKLVGSVSTYLNTEVVSGDADAFVIVGNTVVPKKAGAKVTLRIEDLSVKEKNANACGGTITITAKPIDPVKNLKVSSVVDKRATVSFEYARNAAYEQSDTSDTSGGMQLYFRIRLTDSSKRIVFDKYVKANDMPSTYIAKTNSDSYKVELDNLIRLSGYNVSVTACYLDQTSKAVGKTFKTTNIPAVYPSEYGGSFPYSPEGNATEKWNYKNATNVGIPIYIGSIGNDNRVDDYVLTSNNTYTLVAKPDNIEAQNRQSDTLTWKSSNPKVATVKANTGSYTATLRTVRAGTTNLELVSKVTKRVVARRVVTVNAVADGKTHFFDEYEPWEGNEKLNDINDEEMDIITLDNRITAKLAYRKGKFVKFTAPAYGNYTFNVSNTSGYVYQRNEKNELEYVASTGYQSLMDKGQTLYLYAYAPTSAVTAIFSVTGTIYEEMDMTGIKHKGAASTVAFSAPEDNVYTFHKVVDGKAVGVIATKSLKQGRIATVSLPAGQYTVSVTKREPVVITKDGLKKEKIAKEASKFYVFTAPATGKYTVKVDDAVKTNVTIKRFDAIDSTTNQPTVNTYLEAEKKYYIEVKNTSTTEDIETDVTITSDYVAGTAIDPAQPTTTEVTLAKAGEAGYVAYTIPADGMYRFKATAVELPASTQGPAMNTAAGDTIAVTTSVCENNNNGFTVSPNADGFYSLKKGQEILVVVAASADNAKATITVDVVETKTITPGTEVDTGKDLTLFTYTIPEKAVYEFSAAVKERADGKPTSLTKAELVIGQYTYSMPYIPYRELEKGTEVVFKLQTAEDGDKTVVNIKKLPEVEFTTTTSVNLKKGESKWLRFRAPDYSRYEFTDKTTVAEADNGKGANVYYLYRNADNFNSYRNGGYESIRTYINGSYNAGDTRIIYVEADECDVTYEITAKPATAVAIPSEAFSVAKNSTQWYSFTANETNTYKYELSAEDMTNVSMICYTDKYDDESSAIKGSLNLTAGETRYFAIKNASDTDKSVTLKVEKANVVKAALTPEQPGKATLKDGEEVWYSFKTTEAGRYEFTSAFDAGERSINVTYEVYDKLVGGNEIWTLYLDNYETSSPIVYLDANKTVYVKATASVSDTDGVEVTTSVVKKAVKDMTPTGSSSPVIETVTEAAKGVTLYKINGEFFGNVELFDTEAKTYVKDGKVKAFWIKDSSRKSRPLSSSEKYILEKNHTGYIAVKTTEDKLSYQLKVTGVEAKEFKLDTPVSLNLNASVSETVSYKVPENGWFEVVVSDVTKDKEVSFTYDGFYTTLSTDYNSYAMVYLEKGETFSMDFRTDSEGEVAAKVTLKFVKDSDITDITSTGRIELKKEESQKSHVKFYSYKLTKLGKHIVKFNTDANVRVEFLSNPYDVTVWEGLLTGIKEICFDTYPTDGADKDYQIGDVVRFAVYYDVEPEKDFNLEIKKAIPITLKPGESITSDVKVIQENEKVYGTFVAPEDGRYVFSTKTEEGCGYDVVLYQYDSIDSANYTTYLTENKEYGLRKGDTITFSAQYVVTNPETTPEKSFSVRVDQVPVTALTADGVYEMKSGEHRWFSFTAGKSVTQYHMELDSGDKNVTVHQYDNIWDDDGSHIYSGSSEYSTDRNKVLLKGQTIYFRVGADADCTLKMNVTEGTECPALQVGTNTVQVKGSNATYQNICTTFAPQKAGYYKLRTSSNTGYVYMYEMNGNTDTYIGYDEPRYYGTEPVFIRLQCYNFTTDADLNITIEEVRTFDNIVKVSADESTVVTLDGEGKANIMFSPDLDGVYQFSFSSNVEMYKIDGSSEYQYATGTKCVVEAYSGAYTWTLKSVDSSVSVIHIQISRLGSRGYLNSYNYLERGEKRYFLIGDNLMYANVDTDSSVRVGYVSGTDGTIKDLGVYSGEEIIDMEDVGYVKYLVCEALSDCDVVLSVARQYYGQGSMNRSMDLYGEGCGYVCFTAGDAGYYGFAFDYNVDVDKLAADGSGEYTDRVLTGGTSFRCYLQNGETVKLRVQSQETDYIRLRVNPVSAVSGNSL